MIDRANDVTAFVLAGGRSIRMGRDKATLPWQGETLLTHVLKTVGEVTDTLRIVGSRDKFAAFGSVVQDVFCDRGPLGGIHAALAGTTTELNLVVAVDLPFLSPGFLRYLLSAAKQSHAVVTLPRTGGRWQPLCAVYRREFVESAEQSLRDGKNKIDLLFAKVPLRVIEENELVHAGFSSEIFRNLNTPEDLKQANSNRSIH